MIPVLCNCLRAALLAHAVWCLYPVNTQPVRFQALFLCVLSFKDNFEINNEINDVTKIFEAPEHILLVQFWGLRRPHMLLLIFGFLSFQLQKTPEIPPSHFLFTEAEVWAPANLFVFPLWFFLKQPCREALGSIPPIPQLNQLTSMLIPTVSTAKCDALKFFWVLCCFCLFALNFSFPTKIMPRKNTLCMFPAVSSHLRTYHLHLSVFYSLCKN